MSRKKNDSGENINIESYYLLLITIMESPSNSQLGQVKCADGPTKISDFCEVLLDYHI